jgi:bacillithiol system protein YtxJ
MIVVFLIQLMLYNAFMSVFKFTSHLSEILEMSEKQTVIIFKYSNSCLSSSKLSKTFEDYFGQNKGNCPVYRVTVQTEPVLSRKISDWFRIKHESPQVIAILKGKVVYTDHHNSISLEKAFNNH